MTLEPFPDLRIVPLNRCVLHEQTDGDRVARLVARVKVEETLRNPPVLGRHPDIDTLIVLDGATRVTALQALGVPHVLAQVVDYADAEIELHTWSHVLSNITLDELELALAEETLIREQRCDPQAAEAALQRRETLAYLTDRDGRCVALDTSEDIVDQAAALRRLFAAYASRARIVRAAPSEWRARLHSGASEVAVVFPVHAKDDLVQLAQSGAVLPAGITRHIIPGRALRVNAPLSLLRNPQPLAEKQAWVEAWLQERRSERGVRYYAEPTFLFDE
jgi:L-serine kinase (ATP) / ParB family transcriptional regulator, heme-responsive regulator